MVLREDIGFVQRHDYFGCSTLLCHSITSQVYRLLNNCSENERVECHKYIREQLNLIRSTITKIPVDALSQLSTKNSKRVKISLVGLKMIIHQTIVRQKMTNRAMRARNMITMSNNQMNLIDI